MSLIAQKTELGFEPKMSAAVDAVAETRTPEVMRPSLGPVAHLLYKPTRLKYLVRLSGASATGAANLILYKGEEAVKTIVLDLGETVSSGDIAIEVDGVGGAVPWSVALDVTSAGDAGVTATIDAKLAIDTPAAVV